MDDLDIRIVRMMLICLAAVLITMFLAIAWIDTRPPDPFEVCGEIDDDSQASKDCFDAIGRERSSE